MLENPVVNLLLQDGYFVLGALLIQQNALLTASWAVPAIVGAPPAAPPTTTTSRTLLLHLINAQVSIHLVDV